MGRRPRRVGSILLLPETWGKALEQRFDTSNLLSASSTVNNSKPGFTACGLFHLVTYGRRGSVDILDTSTPLAMVEEQHQGVPFPRWISASRKENPRAGRKQLWKYHGYYTCLHYTSPTQTVV